MTSGNGESMAWDSLDRQYRNTGPGADWVYLFAGSGERIAKFPAKAAVLRREMARYVAEANVLAKGWSLPPAREPSPTSPAPTPMRGTSSSSTTRESPAAATSARSSTVPTRPHARPDGGPSSSRATSPTVSFRRPARELFRTSPAPGRTPGSPRGSSSSIATASPPGAARARSSTAPATPSANGRCSSGWRRLPARVRARPLERVPPRPARHDLYFSRRLQSHRDRDVGRLERGFDGHPVGDPGQRLPRQPARRVVRRLTGRLAVHDLGSPREPPRRLQPVRPDRRDPQVLALRRRHHGLASVPAPGVLPDGARLRVHALLRPRPDARSRTSEVSCRRTASAERRGIRSRGTGTRTR